MRLDKRGRRIGFNWWRDYIVGAWFAADQVWRANCEANAIGYATETAEFRERFPRPTLKGFMVSCRFRTAPDM